MKIIKDLITDSVIGMMIGATVYLGALMLQVQLPHQRHAPSLACL